MRTVRRERERERTQYIHIHDFRLGTVYNSTMSEVFDEFNLVALKYSPIQTETAGREENLMGATKEGVVLLVDKVFGCQYEMTDVGPAAILPKEFTKFPREKRIPEKMKESKWEKYAKEKKITKKKRERMVWNETERKFVPTWGYQSAKDGIEEHGFIEVKRGQDRDIDPYATVSIYLHIHIYM